jgi:L-aspartate oxidase
VTDSSFDLLVIGSGAAGLSAALRASELGARVAVLTAGPLLAGSSPRAQGGVAAALGADDTPALHAADTVRVGAGLNDARAVDVLTRDGQLSVRALRDSGVAFADDLGLEAGHGRRRIHHAGAGATGQVVTTALLVRAERASRISLIDHSPVSSLRLERERVAGVHVGSRTFSAGATVLATGGYAALWARTTNAPETKGSGLQLAFKAGASLADLEFVQFHPTALSLEGAPAFLLSEALRGEGARIVDADNLDLVNPLLPRDVLARALRRHLSNGRRVYLSLRHLDREHVYAHFASLARTLEETAGLDLARDLIPVAPAAHYCMGGIRTDTWGRTDVPGLYAAGEVACSGAQGANRLASNSLLECLVFGARTAEAALTDTPDAHATWATAPVATELVAPPSLSATDSASTANRLDRELGVERNAAQLESVITDLPNSLPALIASAALLRNESRGAHFRADAPNEDPAWRGRIHWRRASAPVFEEVPA